MTLIHDAGEPVESPVDAAEQLRGTRWDQDGEFLNKFIKQIREIEYRYPWFEDEQHEEGEEG